VGGPSVSLSDPARTLHTLWSTLRGKEYESATPLLDLYLRAIESGSEAPQVAAQGINRIRDNYETIRLVLEAGHIETWSEELESILSSRPETVTSEIAVGISRESGISAYDVHLRPMIGRDLDDRPHDFIRALIGHTAVAELAGFKGVILTFDEFEVEHQLGYKKWLQVRRLLEELTDYLCGRTDQPDVPIAVFFAAVSEYGYVGDAVVDDMLDELGNKPHILRAWGGQQRAALARRVHALYCEAYDIHEPYDAAATTRILKHVTVNGEESEIRAFIKCYVGHLDLTYGPSAAA
jgi:hypothetical protein